MSERLEQFLQSSDPADVTSAALEVSLAHDPNDIPHLIEALTDPMEDRRWGAVYALGFARSDDQVIDAFIKVLVNRRETPRVRGQAAELLGNFEKRKAVQPLIECSTDESASVRFWCVFALAGHRHDRHPKVRRAVVRALKARLDDGALPGRFGMDWTVGLEALAMLKTKDPEYPATRAFRETILRCLSDPAGNPDLWQWSFEYWEEVQLPGIRELFDKAVLTILNAGSDVYGFGRRQLQPED